MAIGILLLGCTSSAPPGEGRDEGAEPVLAPIAAPAPAPKPVSLAIGDGTTCERLDDGGVRCRGVLAVTVPDLRGTLEVTDLAVCGRADGAVRCVRPGVDRRVATAFVEVALGAGAKTGRDAEGGVWAFVGEVEAEAKLVPVPLPGPATRIAADGQRACAVLADRGLWCWDPYVALTRPPEPAVVAEGVIAIDAGWLRLCWIDGAGAACWGEGAAPTRVAGLAAPTGIAVGRAHACALADGAAWCWTKGAPARVDGGPFVQIDAGSEHTCGLGADGVVTCWDAE